MIRSVGHTRFESGAANYGGSGLLLRLLLRLFILRNVDDGGSVAILLLGCDGISVGERGSAFVVADVVVGGR